MRLEYVNFFFDFNLVEYIKYLFFYLPVLGVIIIITTIALNNIRKKIIANAPILVMFLKKYLILIGSFVSFILQLLIIKFKRFILYMKFTKILIFFLNMYYWVKILLFLLIFIKFNTNFLIFFMPMFSIQTICLEYNFYYLNIFFFLNFFYFFSIFFAFIYCYLCF